MAMPTGSSPSKSVLRHGLGLLGFLVIGFLMGIAYLIFINKVMGYRPMGFGNAAVIFVMPVWGILFGILGWLPIWFFHRARWGPMSHARAVVIAAIVGLVMVMVFVGPSGFLPRGGSYLLNYPVLAMVILGALAHNMLTHKSA